MTSTFTNDNEQTFTKNYSLITASTKLTALEKLLIARVLNWQQSNLKCTLSNNAIATELGESLSTLKRTITKLNKTPFFRSFETSKFNEFGKWTNSKEITIDEQKLFEYVSGPKEIIKVSIESKPVLKIETNTINETFDIRTFFESYIKPEDEIIEENFDEVINLLDMMEKRFDTTNFTIKQIESTSNLIENKDNFNFNLKEHLKTFITEVKSGQLVA